MIIGQDCKKPHKVENGPKYENYLEPLIMKTAIKLSSEYMRVMQKSNGKNGEPQEKVTFAKSFLKP